MRKLPLLLALGQVTVLSGAARAQSPPRAATPSSVQRLRDQGNAEANAGRLPQALTAWRAAWALSPNNRSLACDIGVGELLSDDTNNVEAARWMSRCARLAEDGGSPRALKRSRSEVVDLAVARSRVAEISIEVEEGAELLLDGESLGTAPLAEPLFVEPGRQYRLEARKGSASASVTVAAVKGEKHNVSMTLKAEPPPFLAPEPKEESKQARPALPAPVAPVVQSPRAFVWWPTITGSALTITAFGIGGALWGVGAIARDEKEAAQIRITADTRGKGCGKITNHPECATFVGADERRVAFSNAATGVFIAGGILAAATLGYTAYEMDRVRFSITMGGAAGGYVW